MDREIEMARRERKGYRSDICSNIPNGQGLMSYSRRDVFEQFGLMRPAIREAEIDQVRGVDSKLHACDVDFKWVAIEFP